MSTITVVTAPSAFAPTGGTNLVFSSNGAPVAGKAAFVVAADTDFRVQRSLDLKVTRPSPKLDAPNGYTQARAQALFRYPKLLANGKITVNTASLTIAFDPEATPTEVSQLLDVIAQMATDSETRSVLATMVLPA